MEAYKFDTIVQENGVIQIPDIDRFAYHKVEVFIVVKPDFQSDRKIEPVAHRSVDSFLAKWQGFLKGINPDEMKSQYLQEKYG